MNERRMARIQELIKIRVAEVIDQELSDPRAGMITVTGVQVDSELSSCLVKWSVIGDDKVRRLNEQMLDHAASFVQREVAKILHTRTVPKIKFVFDDGIARGVELNRLLDEIGKQRDETSTSSDNPFRPEGPAADPTAEEPREDS